MCFLKNANSVYKVPKHIYKLVVTLFSESELGSAESNLKDGSRLMNY